MLLTVCGFIVRFGLGLWCLTQLSTTFQLYRCGQYLEKTTDLSQFDDKLYHLMLYTSPERDSNSTLVVIGTDCTGSCKFNYHTITTTTAPFIVRDICMMWLYCSPLLFEVLLWNVFIWYVNQPIYTTALTFFLSFFIDGESLLFQQISDWFWRPVLEINESKAQKSRQIPVKFTT